jgi:hypothetical protein
MAISYAASFMWARTWYSWEHLWWNPGKINAVKANLPRFLLLRWYDFIIFSLQRPLKTIAIKSGDVYIPRGVSVPALDKDQLWEFQPNKLGNLHDNMLHKINLLLTCLFSSYIWYITIYNLFCYFRCWRCYHKWRSICCKLVECLFFLLKNLLSCILA